MSCGDYLDDFLGDFKVDNEFDFVVDSPKSLQNRNEALKAANDWSVAIGDLEEDVQSNQNDDIEGETSSKDNEEVVTNKNQVNSLGTDIDSASQPNIIPSSAKSWSGVQHDSSKLTSAVEKIKNKPSPGAESFLSLISKSIGGTVLNQNQVNFPKLGEIAIDEKPLTNTSDTKKNSAGISSLASVINDTLKPSTFDTNSQSVNSTSLNAKAKSMAQLLGEIPAYQPAASTSNNKLTSFAQVLKSVPVYDKPADHSESSKVDSQNKSNVSPKKTQTFSKLLADIPVYTAKTSTSSDKSKPTTQPQASVPKKQSMSFSELLANVPTYTTQQKDSDKSKKPSKLSSQAPVSQPKSLAQILGNVPVYSQNQSKPATQSKAVPQSSVQKNGQNLKQNFDAKPKVSFSQSGENRFKSFR